MNIHAAMLGKLGGQARAKRLSIERRKEIARLGYLASPINKDLARLQNTIGQVHEFPWPEKIMTRQAYDALDLAGKKRNAFRLVKSAMARLGLRAPRNCSNCTLPGYAKISAHHDDYAQPMRVRFVCHACHISLHRLSGK